MWGHTSFLVYFLFEDFFVCSVFSVFCFLCSLIPLKKSSLKCFNKFVVHLSFQIYGEGGGGVSGQRPKLCILFRVILLRFFPSDLLSS